jgi:hypothetical protein
MKADLLTGPAMDRFNATVDRLLSVSHEELQRRMSAYKKHAAQNPHKRGPKPKSKTA